MVSPSKSGDFCHFFGLAKRFLFLVLFCTLGDAARMDITYGALRLTVGDGWTDASTITLLGPAVANAAPLLKKANPDAPRSSIIIKRQRLSAEVPLPTFVEAQLRIMGEVMADLKTQAQGDTTWGGQPAKWVELSFKSNGAYVRQFQAFTIIGDEFVALAASAPLELPFDEVRAAAEKLIASTKLMQ